MESTGGRRGVGGGGPQAKPHLEPSHVLALPGLLENGGGDDERPSSVPGAGEEERPPGELGGASEEARGVDDCAVQCRV